MMKMLIANWKAYLTLEDVSTWLSEFKTLLSSNEKVSQAIQNKELTIVICPTFIHIPVVKEVFKDMPEIGIGSQTVSSKTEGKFTGEVTAKALADYVTYSIIGHSERRSMYPMSEEDLQEKLEQCKEHSIEPIFCLRGLKDKFTSPLKYIAYEPVEAIGSGKNADVQDVLNMKKSLEISKETVFIYGGSVDAENVSSYLETGEVQGFLVGTASLKAESFMKLAEAMV